MPVFIGDYLADTMHLSTEQHGAYLLLLFHLWRRGSLHDDDGTLAQITGLTSTAWSQARPVLADFFQIHDGLWRHGRVERERIRVAAKQQSNSKQAKLAAARRWGKPALLLPGLIESADAVSNADALLNDADSHSHSEPELLKTYISQEIVSEKRGPDSRHTRFRAILAEYWKAKNHASPEMPWQGRDAKALAAQGPFNLAILDMNLAGESGLDLLGFFKSNYPSLPVVVFTGMAADQGLLEKALTGGACGFMSKAEPLDKLFAEVNRHLLKAPAA